MNWFLERKWAVIGSIFVALLSPIGTSAYFAGSQHIINTDLKEHILTNKDNIEKVENKLDTIIIQNKVLIGINTQMEQILKEHHNQRKNKS